MGDRFIGPAHLEVKNADAGENRRLVAVDAQRVLEMHHRFAVLPLGVQSLAQVSFGDNIFGGGGERVGTKRFAVPPVSSLDPGGEDQSADGQGSDAAEQD